MFASEPGTDDNDELYNLLGIELINENYSLYYLKTLAKLRLDLALRPEAFIQIASKVSNHFFQWGPINWYF